MAKNKKVLWSFFSSMKLTISLLVLLVIFFIAATFIPPAPEAQKLAWLTDLYHSPIFYILMGFLSLNLIICSLNRLPLTIKQYQAPCFPPPPGLFDELEPNRIVHWKRDTAAASRTVEEALASKLSSVKKQEAEKEIIYFRQQGRFSLFGVYTVHLSVLIMIAGAVIGSIFGLDADLNLREGETANVIELAKGAGNHQLDFSVRCNKFLVEFYDTGAPKTYRSDLSFIKVGKVASQGSVLVNHPFTFEGLRFYQSSYGISPETKVILTYTKAGRESGEITVKQGDTFALPAQKAKATVLRVEENIMQLGPAVKINIEAGERNIQFWVFQHIKEIAEVNPGLFSQVPLFNPSLFKPLVFSLKKIERQYYTGLRVVRDPGVPFVLTGGIILLAGLLIIFFSAHQRVWVRIEEEPEGIKISVAGRADHNDALLQRQLDSLSLKISKETKA